MIPTRPRRRAPAPNHGSEEPMAVSPPPFRPPRFLAPLLLLAGCSLPPGARPARATDDANATGTWMVESWTNKNDETTYALELRWSRGRDHWGSRSVKLDKIPGLTLAQL